MIRRIIFRAKKLDDGEWVYGHYYQRYEITSEGGINEHYIVEHTRHHQTEHHMINPKTLGQYTGRKAIKVKEIFEGDIVREPQEGTIWKIKHEECYWKLIGMDGDTDFLPNYSDEELEIIGNIHDNPELLEESE